MRRERIERPIRRESIRERTDRLQGEQDLTNPRDWRDPDVSRAKALRAGKG
jgi:hypothetical protein